MSQKRLLGSLALSKLIHVRMEKKGKNGMVTGIFIPIAANGLVEGEAKDGAIPVYMPINVVVKDQTDEKGQDGFVSKTIDSKAWKAMNDTEKEESKKITPILGSIKDFSKESNSTADVAGNAGGANVFNADEDDDLPF